MSTTTAPVLALTVLLAVTGCADPGATAGTPSTAAAPPLPSASQEPDTPAAIADCDKLQPYGGDRGATAPEVSPTPAVQTAHDQIEDLQSWAETEHTDSFGGLRIDGDAVIMAFTDDIDARRTDVASRFSVAPVTVVQVAWTQAELAAFAQEIIELARSLGPQRPGWISGVGYGNSLNRVAVDLVGDSADTRARLIDLVPVEALCLSVQPVPGPADAVTSRFSIADGQTIGPETTSIDVLVYELACASGEAATGRVVVHDILMDERAVTVTIGVIPVAGGATCPSNPPTPFTVELPEPLGAREVFDGATGDAPAVPGDFAGD